MTGGTPFDEIQDTLDQLEQPWESTDHTNLIERLSTDVLSEGIAGDVSSLYEQIGAVLTDDENDEFGTLDPEAAENAISDASDEVSMGLAWILASWPNTITATSMVSHGVDVDRFNMMVFFGMPRRTAEYIQSSSRVGRNAPGLVFNIMHPIRERDLSHYHFFEKYHEYLDRLVEPVAINRWAKIVLPELILDCLWDYCSTTTCTRPMKTCTSEITPKTSFVISIRKTRQS